MSGLYTSLALVIAVVLLLIGLRVIRSRARKARSRRFYKEMERQHSIQRAANERLKAAQAATQAAEQKAVLGELFLDMKTAANAEIGASPTACPNCNAPGKEAGAQCTYCGY